MAFGGVLATATVGPVAGPLMLELTGVTLAANAGAFNLAAADSGAFTTDATPPANHNAIAAAFGPGTGNWVAGDVDAVIVTVSFSGVAANSAVGLVSKVLTAGDLVVNFHSTEAGAVAGLTIQLVYLHHAVRGR